MAFSSISGRFRTPSVKVGIYFATNIGDDGLTAGKGTCIWVDYDSMGRMISQTVRTGCSKCSYNTSQSDAHGAGSATCADVEATRTDYFYTWDIRSRLVGAEKVDSSAPNKNIVMSYLYDIGGNRIVREKSNVLGGSMVEIYQDVYLGGTERRHVQLRNELGQSRSINAIAAAETLVFENVENTRELHYAAGARLEWRNDASGSGITTDPPKIFLSFNNHLGSTSAVVDYETGDLVEWNTNYAYGADESRWKNSDPKYADSDEPYGFTGKEEDKAVGLHYFGARYYSSYLGRWLSPDPPVVHGGGLSNHYNYGANSPYIYVDPDGNWIHLAIAAVGIIKGIVNEVRRDDHTAGTVTWAAILGVGQAFASSFGGPVGGKVYGIASNGAMDLIRQPNTGAAKDRLGQGSFWAGMGAQVVGAAAGYAAGAFAYQIASNSCLSAFAGWAGTAASMAAETAVNVTLQSKIYGQTVGFSKGDFGDMMKEAAIGAALDIGLNLAVGALAGLKKDAGMGGKPRIGGAVGSAGDDAAYSQRGGHFGNSRIPSSGIKPSLSSIGVEDVYGPLQNASLHESSLANKLLDHYMDGDGKTYTLTEQEMRDTYANIDISKSKEFNEALSQAKIAESKSFYFVGKGYAGANAKGTLGTFTVVYSGEVQMTEDGWIFKGKMCFSDTYDFGPGNRAFVNELKTWIGRTFIPGTPFNIDSGWTNVMQSSVHDAAIWSGPGGLSTAPGDIFDSLGITDREI